KSLDQEIKRLLEHIEQYTPQDLELEHKLDPFVPDLIPTIGDIDAFIKIPRPDTESELLGLADLDEPNIEQSDPAVLDLHLRAISKSKTQTLVRSMDLNQSKQPLEQWIVQIMQLHEKRPSFKVNYEHAMPDIEQLMQAWPLEMEEALEQTALPTPGIDLPLSQYLKLLCIMIDIPVYEIRQKRKKRNALIEASHVLCSLYQEFNSSAHFK
ncbi:flagellar associated protein, partial [Gorgonomyces haynaldii]